MRGRPRGRPAPSASRRPSMRRPARSASPCGVPWWSRRSQIPRLRARLPRSSARSRSAGAHHGSRATLLLRSSACSA
eukprot:732414-Prymnesium_polylepis.1